ncbi:hypothetical protein V1478_012075 [Vespula squamosa]|uniref:Uncharacterized protein n=1 Tax=Vespula squamosa TaxID=30214 RepID=A0ABD2AC66_VESSQ
MIRIMQCNSDGVPSTRRNLDQHPTCPMQKAQSIDHSLGGSYVGEVNSEYVLETREMQRDFGNFLFSFPKISKI